MRTLAVLTLVVAAALVGSACASGTASADRRSVVASFAPLAEVASRVGGDRVRVRNLTPPGAEPHDLELSPSAAEEVLDADLVIVLGGGFQPAVEKLAERRRGATITVLTGRVADPHIWLDPRAMAALALRVQEALARLDPDGRREFAANATAYRDRLLALDREFAAGLANCERRVIVTSHAAFGVLARRYGLRQEALAGIQPEAEPDPARLDALVQLVRREKVTTVFTEPLVSKRLVATLAREAGVRIAVLDPIESLPAGADYVSVMRKNLATLRAALGCR